MQILFLLFLTFLLFVSRYEISNFFFKVQTHVRMEKRNAINFASRFLKRTRFAIAQLDTNQFRTANAKEKKNFWFSPKKLRNDFRLYEEFRWNPIWTFWIRFHKFRRQLPLILMPKIIACCGLMRIVMRLFPRNVIFPTKLIFWRITRWN